MALFSRRHYEWLAQSLRNTKPATQQPYREHVTWAVIVDHIAAKLLEDNTKFNKQKFLQAINLE